MKFAILFLCFLALAIGETKALLPGYLKNRCYSKSATAPAEQCKGVCLTECIGLLPDDRLDSACEFACKGIQDLIKLIPHNSPSTAATR